MNKLKQILQDKKKAIRLKKEALKECDSVNIKSLEVKLGAANKADSAKSITRTIIGNTYNYMDSHDDVHIKGIFSKSISENGKNIVHLHDHIHQLTAQVGLLEKVYEQDVKWSVLGIDKKGYTTALLMDSEISKDLNPQIFTLYEAGKVQQHSVGMRYVKLDLAVNHEDPKTEEEKTELETFNKYIDLIANQEKVIDQGFYWAVSEAKLIEISCVIRGSNELTPTLENKTFDDMVEFALKTGENLTSKSFDYFCSQLKALQNKEAVNLTLQSEKPQHSIFQIMAKAEKQKK
jgi:hypothetical protein